MRIDTWGTLAGGLALIWLASASAAMQGNPEAAKLENPTPATSESVEAGRKVFQRFCAACHGVEGKGGLLIEDGPSPADLTDDEWKYGGSDGEVFSTIKNGVPPDLFMAPWGERIEDAEIWNLVNFIKSLAQH